MVPLQNLKRFGRSNADIIGTNGECGRIAELGWLISHYGSFAGYLDELIISFSELLNKKLL